MQKVVGSSPISRLETTCKTQVGPNPLRWRGHKPARAGAGALRARVHGARTSPPPM